jgi:hypothetical protein
MGGAGRRSIGQAVYKRFEGDAVALLEVGIGDQFLSHRHGLEIMPPE